MDGRGAAPRDPLEPWRQEDRVLDQDRGMEDQGCPFREQGRTACLAALSRSDREGPWEERCASADHDGCPLYLSRLLMRQRPRSIAPARDLMGK